MHIKRIVLLSTILFSGFLFGLPNVENQKMLTPGLVLFVYHEAFVPQHNKSDYPNRSIECHEFEEKWQKEWHRLLKEHQCCNDLSMKLNKDLQNGLIDRKKFDEANKEIYENIMDLTNNKMGIHGRLFAEKQAKLYAKFLSAIKRIAVSYGACAIIPVSVNHSNMAIDPEKIIISDHAYDITEEAIRLLNQEYLASKK